MSQKTIILTVVLFALIVIGMFVYASLRNNEAKERAVSIVSSLIPV
jgi:Tfp pilus assembly protein PilX